MGVSGELLEIQTLSSPCLPRAWCAVREQGANVVPWCFMRQEQPHKDQRLNCEFPDGSKPEPAGSEESKAAVAEVWVVAE